MRKLLLIGLLLVGSLFATETEVIIGDKDFVSKDAGSFTKDLANAKKIAYKEGFLTSKECAQDGKFKDCGLDSFSRSEMVLYVHDENKIYSFNMNNQHTLDTFEHAINRNQVKMFGKINERKNIITVAGLSVPPGAAKSFFKGCL